MPLWFFRGCTYGACLLNDDWNCLFTYLFTARSIHVHVRIQRVQCNSSTGLTDLDTVTVLVLVATVWSGPGQRGNDVHLLPLHGASLFTAAISSALLLCEFPQKNET